MQSGDEVLDVEAPLENVKDLQDEREERDTIEHHGAKILEERPEEDVATVAGRADFCRGKGN